MSIGVVCIARNDNYGGNLNQRASYCLNSLIKSYDEVIYVDWNSPGQNLIDEIKDNLIQEGKLKYIVVTPEQAGNFVGHNEQAQNCVEVMARNIGIRRLSTDYKVSTNIDIISFDAIAWDSLLREDAFYMMARRHIELPEVEQIASYKEVEKLQKYLLENRTRYGGVGPSGAYPGDKWSIMNCCGDWQLAHKNVWDTIRGYEELMIYRGFADTQVQRKADFYGFQLVPIWDGSIFHINHGSSFGGTSSAINDINHIKNFHGTHNGETWGFSNVDFEMHVL